MPKAQPPRGKATGRPILLVAALHAAMLAVLLAMHPLQAETFTNPIGPGSDPWVIRWHDQYFLCSSGGGIRVAKASKLQDIARSPRLVVWTPPATGMWSKELWAPELHYLAGKWYIYVAADDGDNANHRMYVLEGTTQDPQDPFVFKGRIAVPTDRWAIDGTAMTLAGRQYFIWSGWEGTANVRQNLYIAAMTNPWTLSGDRVRISSPGLEWEQRGGMPHINEGPQALHRGKDTFIIYSASGSWSDYYCLGQLRLTGTDPLDSTAWTKHPRPVFAPTDKVFGPGHCAFTKSPDGGEDWIVYHAAVTSGSGWNRNIRIQKFGWNPDGSPAFGTPVPEGVSLEAPATGTSGISRPAHSSLVGTAPFAAGTHAFRNFFWSGINGPEGGLRTLLGRRLPSP